MRQRVYVPFLIAIGFASVLAGALQKTDDDASWTSEFGVDKSELASTGRNPFFILEPGYQLVLEGGKEQLIITVLDETKNVDGVETRIVEEREAKSGALIEVSRNFFAISKRTNSVFYFGEEVDIYKAGKIVRHEGAWLSGVDGAKLGLIMAGEPLLGARYYQEHAPGVAMDRAEVVGLSATMKTPAGEFKNCLKTQETTPLEPGEKEHKHYARGIGLIQDGSLKLVRHGRVEDHGQLTPSALSETQKIERLIQFVASLQGAKFIRNDIEHSAIEAADHMRMKWKAARDRITTAQQFIEHIASRSSITSKPYSIRLADGSEVLAGDHLTERLREIEKAQ